MNRITMQTTTNTILALDVGERRVGVAAANSVARLSRPVTTLLRGDNFWDELQKTIANEAADTLVIGLPRNLDGDDTAQTAAIRRFVDELKGRISLPVHLQDEALTSRQAEAELKARGKAYAKGDIDALAAVYILEDYLKEVGGKVSS